MINTTSIFSRTVAITCSVLLVNMAVPMTAGFWIGKSLPKAKEPAKVQPVESRMLSSKEMLTMRGKTMMNPYVAGSNKWAPQYKGVDLITGNFSTSATDMTFEGGYGIPINVTRSYSSNQFDEGPIGYGWCLSVDVRSTAGGILKSSKSPSMAVPVAFQERPTTQTNDPDAQLASGAATSPAIAVIATDASGKPETEQRDVDGIITTPPWDKNTNNPTYEEVTFGGSTYRILIHNESVTPDGTTYVYDKEGDFGSGGIMSIDGSGSAEPSNILKITSVTDRQGNTTTYTYDTGSPVSFVKTNGTVSEQKLSEISMPNGHNIYFGWTSNRITTVKDFTTGGSGRTINYGYTGGYLSSVMTDAGLTTYYGYGPEKPADGSSYGADTTDGMLATITDPRGLVTTIHYTLEDTTIAPWLVTMPAMKVYEIESPNGTDTFFNCSGGKTPPGTYFDVNTGDSSAYADIAYGASTPFQECNVATWDVSGVFRVDVGFGFSEALLPQDCLGNSRKDFDPKTQDLLVESHFNRAMNTSLTTGRLMGSSASVYGLWQDTTTTSYNFMGKPLSQTVDEYMSTTGGYINTREQTTDYAYWDGTKYFQQRGTRIQTGASSYRYTMTDYFDSSAAAGAKGQTKEVFSPAFTNFTVSGTGGWQYNLAPDTGYSGTAAAKFYDSSGNPSYDSVGRCTDVWKLQSTATTPWTYVQTHTVYGANGAGHWGQAEQVYEDYGTGKINRETTTNGYTDWGTANDVTDAAGHEFHTDYDGDGKVDAVRRVDGGRNDTIVAYTYGTSGISNGQPTEVTDGLSGAVQDITYNTGASTTLGNANYIAGVGMPSDVTETDPGSVVNSCDYLYDSMGNRMKATYTTPNETTRWGYGDYVTAGDTTSPSHVFQTLTMLDSSSNPTAEEFHYAYDYDGRLTMACFAQKPQSGVGGGGASYYDSGDVAASRCRAFYAYDAGGRQTQLNYWWDTSTTSTSYGTPTAVLANDCSYEVSTGTSNYNRGLKTESDFYVQNTGTPSTYSLDHSELFGYDNNLDYLTSASYDGGTTTTSWSYDAAGNRNDASVCDNLNRATTISGTSRTYDILGNTTGIGSTKSMTWDVLNRMASYTSGSATTDYTYRADGMRVHKVAASVYSNYAYDGQMPMEEFIVNGTLAVYVKVIKYGLGARGIDRIERDDSIGGITIGYPIYDCHGNNVATIQESGSSFTLADQRSYDAWGGVRTGSTTGEPNPRHCANLGHLSDDESGFVYMRARYYEPGTGRFVSQDPHRQGINQFRYCSADPINKVDESGRDETWTQVEDVWKLEGFIAGLLACATRGILAAMVVASDTLFIITWFGNNASQTDSERGSSGDRLLQGAGIAGQGVLTALLTSLAYAVPVAIAMAMQGSNNLAGNAIGALIASIFTELIFMVGNDLMDSAQRDG